MHRVTRGRLHDLQRRLLEIAADIRAGRLSASTGESFAAMLKQIAIELHLSAELDNAQDFPVPALDVPPAPAPWWERWRGSGRSLLKTLGLYPGQGSRLW